MPETSEPTGLLLSDDLMFSSRISGTARDFGLTVRTARDSETLLRLTVETSPACVILDLANPGLEITAVVAKLREAANAPPTIIAYGSHVDTATLKAARAAGCDRVMPRSQFVEELPNSLPRWFASEKAHGPPPVGLE